VRLSAFDYENQHTAAVEATVGDEGECVVPGLFLRDAIAAGRGVEVDLILNSQRLEISSGRSTYRAPCFATDDAPNLPEFPEVRGVVSPDLLREAVAKIAPAISDDPLFKLVQGVRIEGDESALTLVTSDRFRVHVAKIPWSADGSFALTVLGASLVAATKGMSDDVEVAVSDNLLGLRDGRRQWTARLLNQPFAQWERVLSGASDRCVESVKVERADLFAAVKAVGSMTEEGRPVLIEFADAELTVSIPEQERGEGSEVLDAEGSTPFSLATNPRYLADALAVADGPVELRYGGSYASGGPFMVGDTAHPEVSLFIQSKTMPGGTQ
jgi:DNA polymerase-3 subunit beta